jgi:hypothetical protein
MTAATLRTEPPPRHDANIREFRCWSCDAHLGWYAHVPGFYIGRRCRRCKQYREKAWYDSRQEWRILTSGTDDDGGHHGPGRGETR